MANYSKPLGAHDYFVRNRKLVNTKMKPHIFQWDGDWYVMYQHYPEVTNALEKYPDTRICNTYRAVKSLAEEVWYIFYNLAS